MMPSLPIGVYRLPGARGELSSGLASGEVHWWFAFPEKWPRSLLVASREILDRAECNRLDRFRTPKARHLYLVAHLLLRLALSRCTQVHPKEWRFRLDQHGRPEVDRAIEPLRFSLSHTDGLVSCAIVWKDDVGVDVEASRPDLLEEPVASLIVCRRDSLAHLGEDARCARVLQCWTRYEAFSKARGRQLQMPLCNSSFFPAPKRPGRSPDESEDISAWSFLSLSPTPDHQAALAIHRPGFDFNNVRFMRLDPDSTVYSSR